MPFYGRIWFFTRLNTAVWRGATNWVCRPAGLGGAWRFLPIASIVSTPPTPICQKDFLTAQREGDPRAHCKPQVCALPRAVCRLHFVYVHIAQESARERKSC
ncbi:hypothetical protein GN956_G26435 [Arapaima gigas]